MNIAEMVLRYIDVFLSWPMTVLFVSLIFIFKFQGSISGFLGRLTHGEAYGFRVAAASPSEQTRAIERATSEQYNQQSTQDNQQLLAAYQRLLKLFMFEKSYNIIYGSQIFLLEHLESRGDVGEKYINLVGFFERFKQQSNSHAAMFDEYLSFLKTSTLIELKDGDVKITPLGVDFLSYLRASYTAYRLKPY